MKTFIIYFDTGLVLEIRATYVYTDREKNSVSFNGEDDTVVKYIDLSRVLAITSKENE